MVVVVYRKGQTGKKSYMKVFWDEQTPDRINNLNARKPLIPNNYVIEEMGVGESFIDLWKHKYKIKNHTDA
jgi:hypothetical protein